MATKRKTWTVKVKENSRKLLAALLVIFFVAFFLSTNVGAGLAADLTGWDANIIKMWAQDAYVMALGIAITIVGMITISALPVVGILFAAAGLIVLAYQGYQIFSSGRLSKGG